MARLSDLQMLENEINAEIKESGEKSEVVKTRLLLDARRTIKKLTR